MSKNAKLNLNDLSVTSFKTTEKNNGVLGGGTGVQCSDNKYCQNTMICWSEVVCDTDGYAVCIVYPAY